MNMDDLAQRIAEQEVSRIGERVMAKHTPGPWKHEAAQAINDDEGEPLTFKADVFSAKPLELLVAEVYGRTREEANANAAMVGAASDMLAALKKCAGVLAGGDTTKNNLIEALEMGRAAIAKAESKD